MTTTLLLVRYSDVGITSGLSYESKEQSGRIGEAASACGAVTASRKQACRSGQDSRRAAANGIPLEEYAGSPRDRRAARHEQRRTAWLARSAGIGATADCPDGRPRRARLWHAAVDTQASTRVHRAPVRGSVQRSACLAPARANGFFQPEAGAPCAGTRRGGDRGLEAARLATAQKKPAERGD